MKKLLFTFVLCAFLLSCVTSSTLRLDLQTLTGQKKVSQEGIDAVVSEKKVIVTLRPATDTYTTEDRPTLVVGLYCTEEPFDFSTKDIQVFVDDNPHRVLTYNELVADVKEQERDAIKKAKATKSSQYMTGAMSTHDINKEFNATISAIEKDTKKSLKDLNSNILKDIKVLPDKLHGGHIVIEKIPNSSQSHEIKVIVTAASEKHEFLINQITVQ